MRLAGCSTHRERLFVSLAGEEGGNAHCIQHSARRKMTNLIRLQLRIPAIVCGLLLHTVNQNSATLALLAHFARRSRESARPLLHVNIALLYSPLVLWCAIAFHNSAHVNMFYSCVLFICQRGTDVALCAYQQQANQICVYFAATTQKGGRVHDASRSA